MQAYAKCKCPNGTTRYTSTHHGNAPRDLKRTDRIHVRADLHELGELARSYRSNTMPWSIQLRDDTGASAVALIASKHGLTESFTQPFMTKQLDAVEMEKANATEGTVRPASKDDYGTYLTVLASGFGVSKEDLSCFVTPETLGGEATSWFLLEEAGVPVATSLGVLPGNYVGVFNISTLPLHRRRGYARASTSLVLRDAYARGARAAFLHSSSAGKPLYESLGFATVENWRIYVAP